ncbi:MAG: undecaprenyldiphospho-muramoylpentapeptide beta-N-acetylglucosaminyltransferase [Oscillospiraceae bacterium]|nr:undecaprenyldiphospho-muramoylpentapeptide beta-N-acetylglucosaminyltransferase [Oscillospiraceae bacterium]
MRAVIAAGGTAGHINPALAVAAEIMKNEPASEIVFAGREDGMEKKLVEQAGYPFEHFEIHGFERRFRPRDIAFNLNSLRCVAAASLKARRFFRSFKPDVVVGCGGYISGPVVREAAVMGIKTAILEQNSFPGVTTRLLARCADIICVASEDGAERIGRPQKTFVTGNPIRPEFFSADRQAARRRLGVGERVCVVSFGGSLGAKALNELAAYFMRCHVGTGEVFHIHATGQYAVESFPRLLRELGVDGNSRDISVREYIYDMPDCFAAADLVISRSGAITISEIAAAGRASVLIPSPNVSENHQYYNALTLGKAGAARVYEEGSLEPEKAAAEIFELVCDRAKLAEMGVRARSISVKNSAEKIYYHIKKLVG